MTIVRDPAGTTPERTGNLCFVCNREHGSDKTAQHAYDLWHAAVTPGAGGEHAEQYLRAHYWTNAVLHGRKDGRLREARKNCVLVLLAQIDILRPRVIVASGEDAAASLFELGLLKTRWSAFRQGLGRGAHVEDARLGSGEAIRVFCTYHTSARAVNGPAASRYSETTERLLDEKLVSRPDAVALDDFLGGYRPDSAVGRGMRVLFLHWLEIGQAIREAHGQVAFEGETGAHLPLSQLSR